MELGALVYGNSDGPTKKAGMAALRFLSGDSYYSSLYRLCSDITASTENV